ncbi:MAG: ABC transporter permease [Chloroflexi bacterium HGW-Chloroflexi-1]|nr:MAG: ABC transporter permease [Chloroflexi bacterium HGW-Chloroflexi-1]
MRRRDLFLGILALIIAWQLLAWAGHTDVLPGPWAVFQALLREIPRGLGRHFLVSGWRVVASIVISVVTAVPAGLVLGQSPRLNRLFSPIVYIVYPIPKIVFLPIILLFLGIGNTSKVFIIFIILFFQILVVVRDQASTLRPELIYSVRSLGAGRRALFRFVYLPATLPAVLTALRISVGTAIAVLFFAESFATTSGLGYYIIVESWGRLAYPEMYAGVVAMSVLGLLLYFVVDGLERRLAPWMFLRDA